MSVVTARFLGVSTPADTVAAHPALLGCARLDSVLDDLLGASGAAANATDADTAGMVGVGDMAGIGDMVGASGVDAESPGAALWSASDDELVVLVRATDRLAARVAGLRARLVAECAHRDLPARTAATGGTAWLSGVLTARPARAKALWRTATQLDTATPATQAALCAGVVDEDQAAVISATVAALPAEVPDHVRANGEAFLLQNARSLNAMSLAHLANRLLEVVAPDLADARLADQLAREDAKTERVSLTAADDRHGMVSVRGRFDVESWAFIAAALDPLTVPRPGGSTGSDASAAGPDDSTRTGAAPNGHHGAADGVAEPATGATGDGRDSRSHSQRMAEALVELARRTLDAGTLPQNGTVKPHVVVTIPFDELRGQVGAGLLDTGETLSASAVRRLACDAQVTTVILDGHSVPLDLGRTARVFTGLVRRGLILRDRGCAFPGCTRPPAWCDGHHIHHWADGGDTSLDNGVLLCRHHHRVVHTGEWTVLLGPDRRPWFVPPAWIDPGRCPVRNTSHLRL